MTVNARALLAGNTLLLSAAAMAALRQGPALQLEALRRLVGVRESMRWESMWSWLAWLAITSKSVCREWVSEVRLKVSAQLAR